MVFLVSKSGMSINKKRKQFTTLQRKTASSTSFVFHLDYQPICHPPVIYSLFLPRNMKGKKKISALVKMWNRCSNNDWRQLMFSGRSNRLDLCLASEFYGKQTWEMQMWNKGLISQAKKNSILWLHCCTFLLWSDSLDLFS